MSDRAYMQAAWQLDGVNVPVSQDPGKDFVEPNEALARAVRRAVQAEGPIPPCTLTVLKKSFDSRKRARGRSGASFVYSVLLEGAAAAAAGAQPSCRGPELAKRLDAPALQALLAARNITISDLVCSAPVPPTPPSTANADAAERIVVIGAGPAGLFAALTLALAPGRRTVTLLERGEPVERRGRDVGALFVRRRLNEESNLCFGEGGAGAWSDGKLTTRIGRRGAPAPRAVLNELVAMGAPAALRVTAKPHIGTDRLVRVLRAMRGRLGELGCDIRFQARVDRVLVKDQRVAGVELGCGAVFQHSEVLHCTAVVLAPGHSARSMYTHLLNLGVELAPKPFAMGLRIEQPQAAVDAAQYGADLAVRVDRGRGPVPVADYRLTANKLSCGLDERDEAIAIEALNHCNWLNGDPSALLPAPLPVHPLPLPVHSAPCDQAHTRNAYSFCMCPGGQVVPTTTRAGELCVNGMSFSRRDSRWANAAVVVTIGPRDWAPYEAEHGPLAGAALQRTIERRAALLAGGDGLTAPAQLVTDFLYPSRTTFGSGRSREDKCMATVTGPSSEEAASPPVTALPATSYRLGVVPAPLHELFPPSVTAALRKALRAFGRSMPTVHGGGAVLLGVETRTSAPVTIVRGAACESVSLRGLYPCGEGAGYAGGIMSAAVDGIRVALSIVGGDVAAATGERPGAVPSVAAAQSEW